MVNPVQYCTVIQVRTVFSSMFKSATTTQFYPSASRCLLDKTYLFFFFMSVGKSPLHLPLVKWFLEIQCVC